LFLNEPASPPITRVSRDRNFAATCSWLAVLGELQFVIGAYFLFLGVVFADSIASAAGLAGAAGLEGGGMRNLALSSWCLRIAVLRGGRGWPGSGRLSPGRC